MDDFHGTFGFGGKGSDRECCDGKQGSKRNDSSEARNRIHLELPFLLLCMQVWCLRCMDSNQRESLRR
ncbi:hypothetical protein AK973_1505 [Pseudomonas brassicacearum]|nr:hypothetical protein AK973_1505 [Pseudomonas brassicacearum]